ncbi:PH domain-containing protein [Paenisporosarcina sp. OV554]|uniref:PH domain-containing protein n=1 Tax=Paenisporosarcina sp. OV554 TaxID=2135694 RepID=UPI000D3DC7A4|nr:PH domain-containing protein [Paenisporosarcina sp. OV554]
MRNEPMNQISPKGLKVWRLYGVIHSTVILLISIGAGVLNWWLEGPLWVLFICILVPLLYTYIFVYLFPKLRWLRWRYEVREQEIELQHGLFIVRRVLVPMVRVQHVDTQQGPILRKYDLASITISTAATNHTIPALITNEADELRRRISTLARVAEDDV